MAHFVATLTPKYTLAARKFLKVVVRLDPAAAAAWSWLADLLASDYLNRWNEANSKDPKPGEQLLQEAENAVHRALQLAPDLDVAQYANGFVHRAHGNHHASLMAFTRAIELNPNFARAYAQKAAQLVNVGRPEDVPALVDKAIALSPLDPSLGVFYWIRGRSYFFARAYRESIPWLEKSIAARPNLWYNRLYLVSAYHWVGDPRAADVLKEFLGYPAFRGYTLDRVKQDEKANPNDDPFVVNGRAKFHEGVAASGLK